MTYFVNKSFEPETIVKTFSKTIASTLFFGGEAIHIFDKALRAVYVYYRPIHPGIFVCQYSSYPEGCLSLSFRIYFAMQMMLRLIRSRFLISGLFSIILRSACDWWQSINGKALSKSFRNIPLEFPRIHAYTWNFMLLGISFGVWC